MSCALGDEMTQFQVYTVSSFENLTAALNKWNDDEEWEVFCVLGKEEKSEDNYRDRIVLKAKTKKKKNAKV